MKKKKIKKEVEKECDGDIGTLRARLRLNPSNAIRNVTMVETFDIEASDSNESQFAANNCLINAHSIRKTDCAAFWVFFTSYAIFIFMYWSTLNNE